MNMKLKHNCTFLEIYTNNLVKVLKKPLFDNSFSFFFFSEIHFTFVR
jgi:hypothetical protein